MAGIDFDDTGTINIKTDGSGNLVFEHESSGETATLESGQFATQNVAAETIGAGDYHYAGDYPGADADARLDNALSAAQEGGMVWLESATYSSDRAISKRLSVRGSNILFGSEIDTGTTWTVQSPQSVINNVNNNGTMAITGFNCRVNEINNQGGSLTADADAILFTNIYSGSITFNSGTSDGVADTLTRVTITDNGTNTIGDVA